MKNNRKMYPLCSFRDQLSMIGEVSVLYETKRNHKLFEDYLNYKCNKLFNEETGEVIHRDRIMVVLNGDIVGDMDVIYYLEDDTIIVDFYKFYPNTEGEKVKDIICDARFDLRLKVKQYKGSEGNDISEISYIFLESKKEDNYGKL